jgi:hypothetical protein
MNLKITYTNGMVDTVILSRECSTEELNAQIELFYYNPKVSNVEVIPVEKTVGFLKMELKNT